MGLRFNAPPNWPAPPPGWVPPPGWRPDPAWGPPPAGWQLWTDQPPDQPHESRRGNPTVVVVTIAVLLLVLVGAAASGLSGILLMVALAALVIGPVAVIKGNLRWAGIRSRGVGGLVVAAGIVLLVMAGALAPTSPDKAAVQFSAGADEADEAEAAAEAAAQQRAAEVQAAAEAAARAEAERAAAEAAAKAEAERVAAETAARKAAEEAAAEAAAKADAERRAAAEAAEAATSSECDPSYPGVCIPPYSDAGDLDCGEIDHRQFSVREPDPHCFDGDHDGVGCES